MVAAPPPVACTPSRRLRSRRGSVIVMVIILTVALGVIAAGVLSNRMSETRLNERHFTVLKGQNAVESVLDYGVAQLLHRWSARTSFENDELSPSKNPLVVESELKDFLKASDVSPNDIELVGGVVPPSIQFYVNPEDYPMDAHKGKIVLARDVHLYAKASVQGNHVGTYDAFAMQTFRLFDAPLFSHAIFYNMDLEFHPGPRMDINGPVHSNGNIWSLCVDKLYFHKIVTTSGDYRNSMMRSAYQGDWSSMPGESSQQAKGVYIKDSGDVWQHGYRGGASNKEASYYNSSTTDFSATEFETWREYSANKWDGNVQTRHHGIPKLNPIGYEDYVPDYDGNTVMENHAYALIEPALVAEDPYHKVEGEVEKFARKSGIIIRVWEEDPTLRQDTDSDGVIDTYYDKYRKASDGTPMVIDTSKAIRLRRRNLPNDATSAWMDPNVSWGSAEGYYEDYQADIADGDTDSDGDDLEYAVVALDPSSGQFDTNFFLSFHYHQRSQDTDPNSDLQLNWKVVTVDLGNGPEQVHRDEPIEVDVTFKPDFGTGAALTPGRVLRRKFDEMFAAHPYVRENDEDSLKERAKNWDFDGDGFIGIDTDSDGFADDDPDLDDLDLNGDGDHSDIVSGMRDQRIYAAGSSERAKADLDLIEINMGALARLVEDTTGTENPFFNYDFPVRYNGVVYVEFPTDTAHTPKSEDSIVRSVTNMGLFLTEGGGATPALQRVPDPTYNKTAVREEGLTLATNNCLYVRGHFNADGDMSTGSSSLIDDAADPDPPVALAADSISILSNLWRLEKSVKSRPDSDDTEFSAAIVCGLYPTNKSGKNVSSGGSHNFPRFLENWGGETFRYRGSLVALFESEIQNQRWSTSYYSPPRRDWGFNQRFAEGAYPPGTPNVRSFKKTDFKQLSESEYKTAVAQLPWYAGN